ncbi:unnamed protein product [Cuscuta campestris]|uniref:E3 ubiquitin-protein ligase RMA n=2 Tax=Cuscuta sect. Cleistogrammica TaxID=1824901 RepID=A0A484MVK5_9ASTE|nr:hypothetical protein DM860_008956 [Cuscuta australis]VFQ92963.1 unnamed protein product [Cuscuta campestris]
MAQVHGISSEKWESLSSAVDELENNLCGGFDCNICLDLVRDPVVTFCGHLYCWPCIYKWIHSQTSFNEDGDLQQPQCPVCKSEVSEKTLIPIYGRGITSKPQLAEGKAANLGIIIPQRPPPSPRHDGVISDSRDLHHPTYSQHVPTTSPAMLSLSSNSTTNVLSHPMIGMIGEMVYSGMFRNPETDLYGYPNAYHLSSGGGGGTSPRARRQMLEADRSLGRVCFFICCCVVICLLLF